jgi:hypothetical protein
VMLAIRVALNERFWFAAMIFQQHQVTACQPPDSVCLKRC